MNINDVSIARLALAQSASPAEGLLAVAKAQLQLDNARAVSRDAPDSTAAQDAVIETLQTEADAARKHVDKTA